ncbi:MAG: tRNA delta(2)-isopentenylpyrophosphate transferase [Hyphomicrobium sp.]|nr:MAG: tRNA delta(2)-isopentenylpyrophosphate transferase [Hyphomicrobium sp.]
MQAFRFLRFRSIQVASILLTAILVHFSPLAWAQDVQVDTALVVSVDVSNSVDAERYKLQLEGIAAALEDPSVVDAIVNGPNGGILFSMVMWADKPSIALPWTKITNKDEAKALAQRVRKIQNPGGEFTCMSRMLRSINDKIVPQIPAKALRVVIDVSGDGADNCNADESAATVRDELVANGVTVNGLPILLGTPDAADAATSPATDPSSTEPKHPLETWYRDNVMGGSGSFVLPANGYGDFGRAIRQKFVIEISARPTAPQHAAID